jgi:hypothetical protein
VAYAVEVLDVDVGEEGAAVQPELLDQPGDAAGLAWNPSTARLFTASG